MRRRIFREQDIDYVAGRLTDLPEQTRHEAARRLVIVQAWEKVMSVRQLLGFRARQLAAQFLLTLKATDGIKISLATLFSWTRRYREAGPSGLIDRRSVAKAGRSRGPLEGD